MREKLESLKDSRPFPQVPTFSVWLSVFAMFAMRLKSFNALEEELRRPNRWERLIGKKKPSADTLGYTFSQIFIPPIRNILVKLNRRAWRNKSIHQRPGENYRVVAFDGHEFWSSEARCCEKCSTREVERKGSSCTDYYHRAVFAQWVGVNPPGILDLEMIEPHEGEVVAASRLFDRILDEYPRLFDVIVADAIYLEAPFIRKVLDAGKHVVITMKQENRDLYQDAAQLKTLVEPVIYNDGNKVMRIWDLADLMSFTTLGRPMRVVWCEEEVTKKERKGGKLKVTKEVSTWIWVTDLPSSEVPALKIYQWGHNRWDLENRGFNELVNLWGMDHCYVHHPTAIQALLLTLAIAFLTTYLFYERNLKPVFRSTFTRLALAQRLVEGLTLLGEETIWPETINSS